MNIVGHEDLFIGLHFFLGRKMNVCGREDLIFWSSHLFGQENGHLRTCLPCFFFGFHFFG